MYSQPFTWVGGDIGCSFQSVQKNYRLMFQLLIISSYFDGLARELESVFENMLQ